MTRKSRLFRNLALGVVAGLVLVVIVVVAAPLIIPSDFIAAQIAALVRQKTGRALHINGPISFSLVPRVALVAHDVVLASPAGGFTADFLTAKTVGISLKPMPLLHGEIEIDQLKLSEPAVNFEVDKNGRRNWIFHPETSPASTAPSTVKSSPGASFAAGDVTLADGAVSYADDRSGVTRHAGGLNMTLSLPSLDGPLTAAGAAVYNGQSVQLTLGVASPGALRNGGDSAVTVDIAAPNGSFGFHGTITRGKPAKAIGAVDFKTPSLRDLLAWAQIADTQDDGLGPLSIAGKVDFDGSTLALADATVALDGVTATGPLTLSQGDSRLDLDLNGLTFLGGKATGKVTIDTKGPKPVIAASVRLTGITVRQLSFNIAGFDTLSGTGDIAADLSGDGKTMRELVASLNGSGSIAFADGKVGSASLSPLMKNSIGPLINDKSIPREIEYRSLSATATIAQGILRSGDVKLVGRQMSATGTGTLDLARHSIDFEWNPDIVDLGSARIAITGAWDNPAYKVESVNITTKGKGLSIPGLKLR